ncbi:MAG TPA: M24 family metallopeptidase, partial [Bryobacteraceae bacterium]
MIVRRSTSELEKMRASGVLVYQILRKLGDMVEDGTVLSDLEVAAAKMMAEAGAKPAFKHYKPASAETAYPYVLCTSVNHEIVHGMPSKGRKVKRGDIVSIDTGLSMNGYFGDSAITVGVGEISDEAKRLMRVTEESLDLAIEQVRAGNRLFDVSGAVERHV